MRDPDWTIASQAANFIALDDRFGSCEWFLLVFFHFSIFLDIFPFFRFFFNFSSFLSRLFWLSVFLSFSFKSFRFSSLNFFAAFLAFFSNRIFCQFSHSTFFIARESKFISAKHLPMYFGSLARLQCPPTIQISGSCPILASSWPVPIVAPAMYAVSPCPSPF